jgi:hypothetical protein
MKPQVSAVTTPGQSPAEMAEELQQPISKFTLAADAQGFAQPDAETLIVSPAWGFIGKESRLSVD